MDAKQNAGHPFQRHPLPPQTRALPPPPPHRAPRPHEEGTPIFDQLLREWRSGALRSTVSWPVDETASGAVRRGAGAPDDGRTVPRTRRHGSGQEPPRSPSQPER
ncbi:hypothetical protein ACIBK8_08225 [Streptomyces sp. NPDC050161]|uniref:hypothetical protein n=1 Tax=Streptomyces sp. NPDC050161 TaxID=3365604 RepID=UPI0037A022A7